MAWCYWLSFLSNHLITTGKNSHTSFTTCFDWFSLNLPLKSNIVLCKSSTVLGRQFTILIFSIFESVVPKKSVSFVMNNITFFSSIFCTSGIISSKYCTIYVSKKKWKDLLCLQFFWLSLEWIFFYFFLFHLQLYKLQSLLKLSQIFCFVFLVVNHYLRFKNNFVWHILK